MHSSREPGSTKDQGAPSTNSNLTPPSESLCLGQKTNEPTDRSGRPARDASRMYRDPGKGQGEEVRAGSQEGGSEALAFKPGAWRTGYSQGKSRRPGGQLRKGRGREQDGVRLDLGVEDRVRVFSSWE